MIWPSADQVLGTRYTILNILVHQCIRSAGKVFHQPETCKITLAVWNWINIFSFLMDRLTRLDLPKIGLLEEALLLTCESLLLIICQLSLYFSIVLWNSHSLRLPILFLFGSQLVLKLSGFQVQLASFQMFFLTPWLIRICLRISPSAFLVSFEWMHFCSSRFPLVVGEARWVTYIL